MRVFQRVPVLQSMQIGSASPMSTLSRRKKLPCKCRLQSIRRHFVHAPALLMFTLRRHASQSVHSTELRNGLNEPVTGLGRRVYGFLRSSRRMVQTTTVLQLPRPPLEYSAGVVVEP